MKKSKSLTLSTQLFLLTLGLLAFGLIMIYSASVTEALKDFGNKFHFIKLQLQWSGVGIILMLLLSRFNIKAFKSLAPVILAIGLFLLLLVAIPGIGTKIQGARRWLVLPGFTFQPSELFKLIFVIYLSSWLTSRQVTALQFVAIIGFVAGLILLQPDMGTAIVVTLTALGMYYLNDYPLREIFTISLVGIVLGAILTISSPYRASRLQTFLNPTSDPLGSSYHIRQVLLALGSGGIFGVGIGKSRQKYQYLPESTTDSIFAVVGEELGFLGAAALIAAFMYLIYLGFKIAKKTKNPFEKSLAGGITTWLGIQVVLNLTSMVALTPLTGVPLPLISYGGSALVSMLAGIGILLNISRRI